MTHHRRNQRGEKPIKCGMLFPKSLIRPADQQQELLTEGSARLGIDLDDAITFIEIRVGLLLQFKTFWGQRDVFTIAKTDGWDDENPANINDDLICMLGHENTIPELRHRENLANFQGKQVLDWEQAKQLVRLGVQLSVSHAAGLDFLSNRVFRFWVVGDHSWLPEAYMENYITLEDAYRSGVIVSISGDNEGLMLV